MRQCPKQHPQNNFWEGSSKNNTWKQHVVNGQDVLQDVGFKRRDHRAAPASWNGTAESCGGVETLRPLPAQPPAPKNPWCPHQIFRRWRSQRNHAAGCCCYTSPLFLPYMSTMTGEKFIYIEQSLRASLNQAVKDTLAQTFPLLKKNNVGGKAYLCTAASCWFVSSQSR